MRSRHLEACLAAALSLGALALAPLPLASQGLAVAVKGGSTGLGAEAALALSSRIAVRGGFGLLPFEFNSDVENIDYSVDPPPLFLNVGLDLKLAGPLRLSGGLLYRSDDILLDAQVTNPEIGDGDFTGTGSLTGAVTSATVAPFVALGIGHVSGSGLGVYLDLGVAFTGDPGIELSASGPITAEPGFATELKKERQRAEDDLGKYYRYWPIINLGIRFGIGG